MGILVTGAHAKLYVNAKAFGRVETFSFAESTEHREVAVVDTLEPFELVPQFMRVTGSMVVYRIHGDGGVEGAGMKAPVPDIPRQKYFSCLLVDRFTDTVLFRADRCVITSQNWTAQKGFFKGVVSLKALTWSNEVASTTN